MQKEPIKISFTLPRLNKKTAFKIFIGLLIVVLASVLYRTITRPSITPNTDDAIALGRTYGFALIHEQPFYIVGSNSIEGIYEISAGAAQNKLAGKKFYAIGEVDALSLRSVLIDSGIDQSIADVLLGRYKDFQLVTVTRSGNQVDMTFGFKNPQMPLSVSLSAHYYVEPGGRPPENLLGKVKRLPLVKYLSGKNRAEGYWMITDFSYEKSLTDYYNLFASQLEN